MVDLTAKNMSSTSSKNRKEWGEELKKVFLGQDEAFALVTSVQLVGVCLYLFVRQSCVDMVRDVAVDTVKTGAGGKVGNKGGVGIRLRMFDFSVCFVCAHLPAGQSHVAERNADYHNITDGLAFGKGRKVNLHDYVFWCGDFNYRIDLPNDECKRLIVEEQWETLRNHDQLCLSRKEEKVFVGFEEGTVEFVPTYKYDIFSEDWDTSEKQRCPAWTDRVLYRQSPGHPCHLIHYGRNDTLKMSDHRPVLAMFMLEANEVDTRQRNLVRTEVLNTLRESMTSVLVRPIPEETTIADVETFFSACEGISVVEIEEECALVTFKETSMAEEALKLNGALGNGALPCQAWR